MAFQMLDLTRAGGVARLTITHEAGNNSLTHQGCREFAQAALDIVSDPEVRIVLLRGRGDRAFCVGGDLKEFFAQRERIRAHLHDMATFFHQGVALLRNGSAPVVMAINGVAAGGGFSLALNADIGIARRSAKFVAAYTRSGLSPDAGGTWFLPRLVGLQRAFHIFATNPTLTADQALELGLVAQVVDDDVFDAEVEKLVASLVAMPAGALAALKRLFRTSPNASLEEQLVAEADSIADSAQRPSTIAKLQEFTARSK